MTTELNDLEVGDKVRIAGYAKDQSGYRNRLLAMGLVPGTEFTLTRKAPLGDPIEISIRGFALILRKKEASILKLERVSE